jgi:hypothetical protein
MNKPIATNLHTIGAIKSLAMHKHTQPSTTMKQLRRLPPILAVASATLPAWAHEGHGMPGFAHWHASDVLGFVAVAGVIAAFIWFKGGK